MARTPTLRFDRGTLTLHPPPKGRRWLEFATWDDRIERFRIPATQYRDFLEAVREEGVEVVDKAQGFGALELVLGAKMTPFPHQHEALEAWKRSGRRGVVVLPAAYGRG